MGKYKVIFTLFYYIMKGGINNTHQNHLIKNLVKYTIIPHFDDVWSPLPIIHFPAHKFSRYTQSQKGAILKKFR